MRAQLDLDLGSAAEAQAAAAAIAPDNGEFLQASLHGATLRLVAEGPARTVIRTLDDALGCLRAIGHL